MIDTGVFIINFYNIHGGKIKDLREQESSLVGARELGEAGVMLEIDKYKEAKSFTIDRRIFNSIDSKERF